MKIETIAIRNGQYVGDILWVCQYHRPDLNKKPLRNISPTKVMVRHNKYLPENKTVYYSETHFCPLSSSGKILSKVISPVDNTGYRSYQGNEIDVFTTEEECIEEWNRQVDIVCAALKDRELKAAEEWRSQRLDLKQKKL